MDPGEKAEPSRKRPCGVLPAEWSPHRPPAPLHFRSQAGHALYLRHAGRVGCKNSSGPAEAATRKEQKHKTPLAAPLEAQSQTSQISLGRARGSQSETCSTLGAWPVSERCPVSRIPRGAARARAKRSRRGRREQVGTAEVGSAQGDSALGPAGFSPRPLWGAGLGAQGRGRRLKSRDSNLCR